MPKDIHKSNFSDAASNGQEASLPRFGGTRPQTDQFASVHTVPSMMMPPQKSRYDRFLDLVTRHANIIAVLYVFGGEFVLPDSLKASTIIAEKTAGIQEDVLVDVAPEKTAAVIVEDTAKAEVNLYAQCTDTILKTSAGIFQNCMAQPKAKFHHCQYQKQLFLTNTEDHCPAPPEPGFIAKANKKDFEDDHDH